MPVSSDFRKGMTLSSTGRTVESWHDVEKFVGLFIDALQPAIGRDDMQPVGKEQIDLPGIFAQGRKAGGIIRHVECGADAFFLRSVLPGSAPIGICDGPGSAAASFRRSFAFSFSFSFKAGKGASGAPAADRAKAHRAKPCRQKNYQQRNADADDIESQPYSLPASLARIVKNRLRHEDWCLSILS